MARMSAKAQARYDELKRISAKGGSTLMSNAAFEYVADSATEGQFALFTPPSRRASTASNGTA